MNFLAHLYLSGDSEDIMLGNFIGDFVKGHAFESYSPGVQDGILLHRKIDHFTDHHAVVSESKDLLRRKYRHYSGVIVDMFYDHMLASSWSDYHADSLEKYSEKVYTLMNARSDEMPPEAAHMLTYMAGSNWLLSYAAIEGINKALSGMSRRTTFKSRMEEAAKDLTTHYEAFRDQFQRFFPDLMRMVATENDAFRLPA